MIVLQVVGYRKRGKTSLIETICEELNELGIDYIVIKQTKHSLEDVEKGDTKRFLKSGAKKVVLFTRDGVEVIKKDGANLYDFMSEDVVILEGWKSASRRDWWTVVVAKDVEEARWLLKPNTIAVLTSEDNFKIWGKVIGRKLAVASRLMK